MRTCSVCGTEIDKTTAYTVSGEQKAQGRRCINCVEGAENTAPKAAPASQPAATAEPVAEPSVAPAQPSKAASSSDASTHDSPQGVSKTTYIIAAIAVIVVLIALSD